MKFSPIRFKKNPIAKSKITLKTFLNLRGLFLFTARGIAVPMINKKEGKTKSATERPFQSGWISHQQAPSIYRVWSARIIPKIVKPL